MEDDIEFRKAVEADLDDIAKLYEEICDYLEAHRNYPRWNKDIYPTRHDAGKGITANTLYIAKMGQKTIGTVILNHQPEEGYRNGKWLTSDDYDHICVIHTLAVHPGFLKRGIGFRLLQFAERMAREEQCISIRLDVVKDNIPAEQLYRKCGYQSAGTVSLGYEAYGIPWFRLYEKIL